MNKIEAYAAMLTGKKVKHAYYTDKEYVFLNSDNKLETEDGVIHGTAQGHWWHRRQSWNDGWSIYGEPKIKCDQCSQDIEGEGHEIMDENYNKVEEVMCDKCFENHLGLGNEKRKDERIAIILIRWQEKCFGWNINVNDNKTTYTSAKDTLEERQAIANYDLDINPEIRAKMEGTNQYVNIVVYPDNGIGSYEVFHYDLIGAILEMDRILEEETGVFNDR